MARITTAKRKERRKRKDAVNASPTTQEWKRKRKRQGTMRRYQMWKTRADTSHTTHAKKQTRNSLGNKKKTKARKWSRETEKGGRQNRVPPPRQRRGDSRVNGNIWADVGGADAAADPT